MVSIRDRVSQVLLVSNVNCLFFSSKYDFFCKTEIIEEDSGLHQNPCRDWSTYVFVSAHNIADSQGKFSGVQWAPHSGSSISEGSGPYSMTVPCLSVSPLHYPSPLLRSSLAKQWVTQAVVIQWWTWYESRSALKLSPKSLGSFQLSRSLHGCAKWHKAQGTRKEKGNRTTVSLWQCCRMLSSATAWTALLVQRIVLRVLKKWGFAI